MRLRSKIVRAGASAAGLFALGALSMKLWVSSRSQPEPVRETWFAGVLYERLVLRAPRPVVAHLVRIDLQQPGIELVVTPPELSPRGEVRSRTTSSFAAQHGVQLAINASYFYPFRNKHPLDYTPHPGDPVHVLGLTAAQGTTFGRPLQGQATLHVSATGQISFDRTDQIWNAVSGMGYLLRDGALATFREDEFSYTPYPRTLIAQDMSGRFLLLLVIDGKQPRYSEGLTLEEAAQLFLQHGAWTCIQLDGGGSSTLVRQNARAEVELVNSPANFQVPGWERSVATQLGLRAPTLAPVEARPWARERR